MPFSSPSMWMWSFLPVGRDDDVLEEDGLAFLGTHDADHVEQRCTDPDFEQVGVGHIGQHRAVRILRATPRRTQVRPDVENLPLSQHPGLELAPQRLGNARRRRHYL